LEDGSVFLPIQLPVYTASELSGLCDLSFSQIVAKVLNQFFLTNVTGWDIELSVGKKFYRLNRFGRKQVCAEFWHNSADSSQLFFKRVYSLICGDPIGAKMPSGWVSIAIRIAMLFGVYPQLVSDGIFDFDIALSAKFPEDVVAAFYAKKMGFPVGKILCGSNENCDIWELVHKGEFTVNRAEHIEHLLCIAFGYDSNTAFLNENIYRLESEQHQKLSNDLVVSVIGQKRISNLINSAYRTDRKIIDPEIAAAYGALQDHRSKTGESRPTVFMSHNSPVSAIAQICDATGLKADSVRSLFVRD